LAVAVDRFYTPDEVAATLLEAVNVREVGSCADPTCGQGQLLKSAESEWPHANFSGIDIDSAAIRQVRRDKPHWVVSVGNLMLSRSVARTRAFRSGAACDVLLTNPPFSMGKGKGVRLPKLERRCSVAMAYLLTAIDIFEPSKAVGAIVPESLLFADLDAWARDRLQTRWSIEAVESMPQSTFKGARARASLIVLRPLPPSSAVVTQTRVSDHVASIIDGCLVRGGLPVHQILRADSGALRFVHSTDLGQLSHSDRSMLSRVPKIKRGVVDGNVVLFPRVGMPIEKHVDTVLFRHPVQLSDCVIALRFRSARSAAEAATLVRANFRELVTLYRGTAARYVTVARLVNWLTGLGVAVTVKKNATGDPSG
jgi:hypothetical protein